MSRKGSQGSGSTRKFAPVPRSEVPVPAEALREAAALLGRHFRPARVAFFRVDTKDGLEVLYDAAATKESGKRSDLHQFFGGPVTKQFLAGEPVVAGPGTSAVRDGSSRWSAAAVPIRSLQRWNLYAAILKKGVHEWTPANLALIEAEAENAILRFRNSQAEAALSSKDAEFQAIADNTPLIFIRVDRDLRYRFINKAGANLFAMPPSQLVGRSVEEIAGPETFKQVRPYMKRALAGEPVDYEREIFYPAVGMRSMRISYVPERDGTGRVTGFLASVVDMTEQKRAENDQKFLLSIAEKIRTATSAEDLLADISHAVGKYLGLHRCLFNEIDLDRDVETVHRDYSREGHSVAGTHKISKYSTVSSKAMRAGQTVVNNDSKTDKRTAHLYKRVYGPSKERSYVTVPMLREGRWKASLWCSDDKPRLWTTAEVALVESIAERVWSAVERVRAEAALRESEERFSKAFDASPLVLTISSLVSGKLLEVNKTFVEVTGFSRAEALGKTTLELGLWARPADRRLEMDTVRKKGRIGNAEYLFRVRDGSEIVGLLAAETIEIGGEPCTLTVIQDITARKIAEAERSALYAEAQNEIRQRRSMEEALRKSEEQLRVVTDAMPALISYVDKNERYVFANKTYNEWFGLDPASIIGKKTKTVFGLSAYKTIKPWVDRALAGKSSRFEAEIRYKYGGTRYVHVAYVPDLSTDGTVQGYFGFTIDMTDLKRSEELLRVTEEKTSMMMDTCRDYAILSTDPAGFIDSWNIGAEQIFGYAETEAIGMHSAALFTPEDQAQREPEKEMRTAKRNGRASDERWHIRKDGSRFYASGVMMPLYVGPQLAGYAKIATDLTEKQKQAEQLQRAYDELEMRVVERTRQLAETNSALIREAEARLAGEQQRIYLLRRLVTSQEFERRRIARDIHDQLGQRLTGLRLKLASLKATVGQEGDVAARVARLQEISERLDAEVSFLAWELRPTALDDLGLVEALRTFVHEWSRHYEITADFHALRESEIRLDPDIETHLYRITQEALNNTMKHANATNISVMLERRSSEVLLIIEDDGKGFDPAALAAPKKSGKGLGLMGMKERATLIGGGLEIESSGNGTTIYVRVPTTDQG